jgi:ribosomal protein S18 acetylase RimI-like enzyme
MLTRPGIIIMEKEVGKPEVVDDTITLRTELRPGDLEYIVYLHGVIYARERGFDHSFGAYVAEPLAAMVRAGSPRDKLWLAERAGRIIGCVAMVGVSPKTAQLRWFLVDPAARGAGLGRRLLKEAIQFCREAGYEEIVLWTESALQVAAHLYQSFGFRKTEEKPGVIWGVELIEEKYEMRLM